MKKKILVTCSVIVCVLIVGIFVFAGMGISFHTGRYLASDNGSHMIIMDNSPIVMSDRKNENMFKNLTDGDKILIFHDSIQESYPGGTLVYAYLKLSDGDINNISETVLRQLAEIGWTSAPARHDMDQESESFSLYGKYPVIYSPDLFDITTVSSNSTFDTDKIKLAADNADFMNDEDNYHFSVFSFDSYESFNKFLTDFDKDFDNGYSNADDFRKKLQDLNEEYFKDNSVIIISYYTGAGNVSYNVESVYFDGEICRLNIAKHTSGQGGPSVITSYIKAVGVEKGFLGECNSFDAVLID